MPGFAGPVAPPPPLSPSLYPSPSLPHPLLFGSLVSLAASLFIATLSPLPFPSLPPALTCSLSPSLSVLSVRSVCLSVGARSVGQWVGGSVVCPLDLLCPPPLLLSLAPSSSPSLFQLPSLFLSLGRSPPPGGGEGPRIRALDEPGPGPGPEPRLRPRLTLKPQRTPE